MRIILFIAACLAACLFCRCTNEYIDVQSVESQPDVCKRMPFARSSEDAARVAVKHLKLFSPTETRSRVRSVSSVDCVFSKNSTRSGIADSLLYVVNFSGNDGFMLVPYDIRGGEVLAFVPQGNYDPESSYYDENSVMDMVLGLSEDYITYAIIDRDSAGKIPGEGGGDDDGGKTTIIYGSWTVDSVYNQANISTLWGQGYPFNIKCPVINDANAKAGCVAIAIAQVVAHHNYPAVIGDNFQLDWPHINQHKENGGSIKADSVTKCQVAQLIRDIGHQVDMDYGLNSSGAQTKKAVDCFKKYGYRWYGYLCDYDEAKIRTSLSSGCPVIISGYENQTKVLGIPVKYSDGHAWVLDGCLMYAKADTLVGRTGRKMVYNKQTKTYMRCNFGWYGRANGYYLSGVFDTRNRYKQEGDAVTSDPVTDLSRHYNYKYKIEIIPGVNP